MSVKVCIRRTGRSLRVFCPDCGHDWFHQPLSATLYDAVADACAVAEAMSYNHLTGIGQGERACPIREYAWVAEEERECERASTVRPHQPAPVA